MMTKGGIFVVAFALAATTVGVRAAMANYPGDGGSPYCTHYTPPDYFEGSSSSPACVSYSYCECSNIAYSTQYTALRGSNTIQFSNGDHQYWLWYETSDGYRSDFLWSYGSFGVIAGSNGNYVKAFCTPNPGGDVLEVLVWYCTTYWP